MKFSIAVASYFAAAAAAAGGPVRRLRVPPLPAPPSAVTTEGTFQQLIDHDDPSLGTFSQRYWYNDEFYQGAGSPVVLFTPGEEAADQYLGYLTNATIPGEFAQAINGAVILLEHRYWGQSTPFNDLNSQTLQYLTLNNSISDLIYFANTAQLAFDPTNSSSPSKAPWVLTGGSYSGALTAWTEATQPGTFWAYHASSAPVQAIFDMWTYFEPISQGMPQNCSTDVGAVIEYMDNILANGTAEQIADLKNQFGLGTVDDNQDFMYTLAEPIFTWQEMEFFPSTSTIWQFCDTIEGVQNGGSLPGAGGVGLDVALPNYASYVQENLSNETSNSVDSSDDDDSELQWEWLLCNEPFAYWQAGPPLGSQVSPLLTRLIQPDWYQDGCAYWFPAVGNYTYGSAEGLTPDDVNAWTGGWNNLNRSRLLWVNGEFDPWRSGSVSSDFRPDGPLQSTPEQPIFVIPDGIHCYDLLADNADANPALAQIVAEEISQIQQWVGEFQASGS